MLVSLVLSSCNSSSNETYYTNEDANISASPIILENDFENITQEEMNRIYQVNYGWTDLKSHELLWDEDTILIKFYFGENAKRWQIDAARAYTYKEMKYVYINNYELTQYQFWRMDKFIEIEPRVCAEVYIDDKLLIQDLYEDEIPIKYENTSMVVDARRINSTWTKDFDQYIDGHKKIYNVEYQNSLLGKAVIVQIHSNDTINLNVTTEIKEHIKNEIADKAIRDNEQDTDNEGKYLYIVLELYKDEEKYYEDVLINQEEIEWKQFDWMNI